MRQTLLKGENAHIVPCSAVGIACLDYQLMACMTPSIASELSKEALLLRALWVCAHIFLGAHGEVYV